jgi:Repeat of unknown function (DUF5648)
MVRSRAGAFLIWAVLAHGATAAVTSEVVDLPGPGVTQRYKLVTPDVPTAYVLVLPGGEGYFNIGNDGTANGKTAGCNPVFRYSLQYAARGLGVVLANSVAYDLSGIIPYLLARHAVPIWLMGGSSSTGTVGYWAATLPAQSPVGAVFFSPQVMLPSQAAQIARPALIVYHAMDPDQSAVALSAQLTSAPIRQLTRLTGGNNGVCGYHLFEGLDAALLDTVATFIEQHGVALQPASKVAVVEYFNADFGHYFMTAQADEIVGLDAGAYNFAFARTGLGFNAWNAPAAGTVPVCRFFTKPGTFETKSSHFYTADAVECDGLKSNPAWVYEKIAFHIAVPGGGVCPAGTSPVYRMYNHGQTGAPNHRFTTDLSIYQEFTTSKGWDPEGIGFCSPP